MSFIMSKIPRLKALQNTMKASRRLQSSSKRDKCQEEEEDECESKEKIQQEQEEQKRQMACEQQQQKECEQQRQKECEEQRQKECEQQRQKEQQEQECEQQEQEECVESSIKDIKPYAPVWPEGYIAAKPTFDVLPPVKATYITAAKWLIPSAVFWSLFSFLATVYLSDWRAVTRWIPFYNTKYAEEERQKAEDEAAAKADGGDDGGSGGSDGGAAAGVAEEVKKSDQC